MARLDKMTAARSPGYGREFRLYAVGQTVSVVGDRVALIALVYLVIHLSGSFAPALSLFYICRALPPFVAGLASGVIADHFDRRRLMIRCDLGRAVLLALVPAVTSVQLWTLYPIVIVLFALTTLFGTAARSALPDVVPKEKMMGANAILTSINSGADIAYAVAGVLIFASNLQLPFYIDAVTFLFSAAMIGAMRLPYKPPSPMPRFGEFVTRSREGIAYLLANPFLRWSTTSILVATVAGGAAFVLSPLYASHVLAASPGLVGPLRSGAFRFSILEVGLGGGILLGGPAAAVLADRLPRGTIFAAGLAGSGIADALLGLTNNLYVATALMVLSGIGFGVFAVSGATLVQALTTTEIRGRVFAARTTATNISIAIGSAAGGFALLAISYRALWVIEGSIIAAASLFVWLRADVRNQP